MALENLKQNIEMEKNLLKEISIFSSQLNNLERLYPYEKREEERRILIKMLDSSIKQLRIINNSIPEILDSISPFKKLVEEKKPEKVKDLVKISYPSKTSGGRKKEGEISVTIKTQEREDFIRELNLSKETLERLKKEEKKVEKKEFLEFKKPSLYAKISNKLFLNLSNSFIKRGYFKKLNLNLRKANMPYLLTTYLSMAFFSMLLASFFGLILFAFLFFYNPGIIEILRNFLLILVLPFLVFVSFYFYPYAEAKSVESKINQELPFVTIHMAAISGSGIEPSQIFKIISMGEEYKYTKKEIKKIMNQINLYGYDLVTALKNTARGTSSKKFAELLNGMATTISGGGSLSEFLDKRADTLLFEYRLKREKYTKSAETFMDIYISIVIAAPMIFTLLLVLITVSGINIGMSLSTLTVVIVSVISLINIIFLVYLHLSQPTY